MAQSRKPTDDLQRTAKDLVDFISEENNKKALEEVLKKAKEDKAYKEKGWGTYLYEGVFGANKPTSSIPEPDVYDQIQELFKETTWTETSLNTFFFRELIKRLPEYDAKIFVSLEQLKLIYAHAKLKIEQDNFSTLQNLSASTLNVAATAARIYQKEKTEEAEKEKQRQAVEKQSIVTNVTQKIENGPKDVVLSQNAAEKVRERYEDLVEVTEKYVERTKEEAVNRPSAQTKQDVLDTKAEMQHVLTERQDRLKEEQAEREARAIEEAAKLEEKEKEIKSRPGVNQSHAEAWNFHKDRTGAKEGLARFGGFSPKPVQKKEEVVVDNKAVAQRKM